MLTLHKIDKDKRVQKMKKSIYLVESEVAKYDHFTQTISAKNITNDNFSRFKDSLKNNSPRESEETIFFTKNVLQTIVHELQHWMDINCSIYGLYTVQNILALQYEKNIKDPILYLKQRLGLRLFTQTINYQGINNRIQCVPSLSIPERHEDIKHWSYCFSEKNSDTILFKSPIFLGSMLECNAVFQETIQQISA
ncbi:hypothetical protein [[Leptolyngbya] sp. PCC 7376]|uniref:hypothetical protein n=1 Tax=[Leptolyngbya] sp. PCC 7376 TaxID=111781 RepID=UPI00059F2278|nr:hypothetical protein [[Leptolyngbya] sp. PCC 7376]